MTEPPGQDLKVPIGPTDHVRGSPEARITVVEYGDFECPICRAAEPGVRMLLDQHPTTLRLIYRHFPVESAHPHALMAAEAAEAAGPGGKIWGMHGFLLGPAAPMESKGLHHHPAETGGDLPQFPPPPGDGNHPPRGARQGGGGGTRPRRTS